MKRKILSIVLSLFLVVSVGSQLTITSFAASNKIEALAYDNTDLKVIMSKTSFEYTGTDICPKIEVYDGDFLLTENIDYLLDYRDNISPGKGSVTVFFIGAYDGEITKYFNITLSLNKCHISISKKTYVYENKSYKPTVRVTDKFYDSISKKDYTVTYRNNRKVGKASVIISGKNSIKGKRTVNFNIIPKVNKGASIYVGQTYKLNAKSSAKISYKSSNAKVVKVNSKGVATALRKGSARVTIKSNGQSNSIKINVKQPYVSLSKSQDVVLNRSVRLNVKKYPSNVHISWSTSNKKIATVNSKGVVKGKSKGTTKITAKFKYAGRTYKSVCTVRVAPVKKYNVGTYKVGRDMPAGEYVLYSTNKLAYFSINSDSSGSVYSIISNDNFDNTSIVKVYDGEYLELKRCYAINIKYASKNKNYESGGMFKVGRDIAPGEYKLTSSGGMGYYEVSSDSRHSVYDIKSNDNFYGSAYVTVKKGDYLKLVRCYMSSYYN